VIVSLGNYDQHEKLGDRFSTVSEMVSILTQIENPCDEKIGWVKLGF
jgi:hypothetical protein